MNNISQHIANFETQYIRIKNDACALIESDVGTTLKTIIADFYHIHTELQQKIGDYDKVAKYVDPKGSTDPFVLEVMKSRLQQVFKELMEKQDELARILKFTNQETTITDVLRCVRFLKLVSNMPEFERFVSDVEQLERIHGHYAATLVPSDSLIKHPEWDAEFLKLTENDIESLNHDLIEKVNKEHEKSQNKIQHSQLLQKQRF